MRSALVVSALVLLLAASGDASTIEMQASSSLQAVTGADQTDQPAVEPLMPVSGLVFGADKETLVIRTSEGKYITAALPVDATITLATIGSASDVKQGATVVVGSIEGESSASETMVLSAPPSGSGPSPIWFQTPVNKVDTGTVETVTETGAKDSLSVSLEKSDSTSASAVIDEKTLVTVIAYADASVLLRDAHVRALVTQDKEGNLTARLIEVAD